jgi:hypothetical protein
MIKTLMTVKENGLDKNKFENPDNMRYNSNKDQNQGSYKCELCGTTLCSRREFEDHIRLMHGIKSTVH